MKKKKKTQSIDSPKKFWRKIIEPKMLKAIHECMEDYNKSVLEGNIVSIPATVICYKQTLESEIDNRIPVNIKLTIHADWEFT